MSDLKYKGRTKAEWLVLEGHDSMISPAIKTKEALLWFEAEEKKARFEVEERRFQTQLDETNRHGLLTRRIAGFALLVSSASVGVAIVALNRAPQPSPQAPATLSQVPAASVPQTTNSLPSSISTTTNQVLP